MRLPVIMVVDDDRDFLAMMELLLTWEDYRILPCGGPEEVHHQIALEQPHMVIVVVRLHDHQRAVSLLAHLRGDAATRAIGVLVCSADRRFFWRYGAELEQLGAATLEMPFDLDELLAQIARLIAPGVTAPEHMAPLLPRRWPWPSR